MAAIKLVTSTAPARRVCVGCDMLMEPAAPGAPLCRHCAPDPDEARRRIGVRLAAAENIHAAADRRRVECLAALSSEERDRWHKFERARRRQADGETLPPKLAQRLGVAADAMRYGKADDAMGTPALVALYHADEAWYWAGQEYMHYRRRHDEQLAVLDAWARAQSPAAAD